jgi:chromosome segregation ATPase
MEQLSRIYSAIVGDEIAYLFSAAVLVWFIVATILLFLPSLARRQFVSRLVSITPSSLATLGVLGTFTGILIGLLDFDVERIDESVPSLLAGLKIAFATSIVGITGSIGFRLVRTIAPSSPQTAETTPEDIQSVLEQIRDDGRRGSDAAREQMQQLKNAIASDGDGSLLTQIQKLRTTLQDGQAELTKEFRQFAQHMVENNQKAIVEALEQVIRDFNQNLTEQFGQNFKELNAAVAALVVWQDKHKENVDGLQARLDAAVNAIEATQAALEKVQTHSESIPPAIAKLEPALAGISAETDALQAHLEAIAELKDKAIDAFPVIDKNLEKITTDLSASVENAVSKSQAALADNQAALSKLTEGYTALLSSSEEAQGTFSKGLTDAMTLMAEKTSQEFTRHGELIEGAAGEAQKAIQDAWASSSEKINQQFEEFDRQMQQELQRSLELLGNNLASLSEKFVADYAPLTDKLRDLVNASRAN